VHSDGEDCPKGVMTLPVSVKPRVTFLHDAFQFGFMKTKRNEGDLPQHVVEGEHATEKRGTAGKWSSVVRKGARAQPQQQYANNRTPTTEKLKNPGGRNRDRIGLHMCLHNSNHANNRIPPQQQSWKQLQQ